MLEERLAPASTFLWTGASGTDGNWGTGANWSGGMAPANNDSGDTLTFSTATGGFAGTTFAYNPTNNLTGLTNLTVNVTDNAASTGFTLSGNSIDTSGGGVIVSGTNSAGTETLALAISGTGAVVQAGSETLTITGANSYSGPTTISQGTVNAENNTALGTGAVTVSAGAALRIPTLGTSPGLLGQYYNITPANVGNSNPNFASLAALTSHLNGLTPAVTSVAPPTGFSATTFDFNTTGSGFPSPYTSGATNFEVRWTGIFTAPVAGSYTFDTASDDGSMLFIDGQTVVNNNFFQGVATRSGSINLAAGQHSIVIGFYQGGGGYGLYADVSYPGQVLERLPLSLLSYSSGGPVNLTIGSLSGGGSVVLSPNGSLTLGTDNTNQTFSGVVSGANNVTKVGTGTETFSGLNTFGGLTFVQNGTLRLAGAANVLPTQTAVTLGNGTTGGILDLNGQNQQLQDLYTSGTGTDLVINSGGGTPTLSLAPSDTDTFTGTLGAAGQASLSLVMNGTGALVLSGANVYTGTTTVLSGTLEAGSNAPSGAAGAFGNGTSAVLVGATTGSSSSALLTGGAVTIGRNVTVQSGSSGTVTLGGATANNSIFSGTITLQKGVTLSAAAGGLVNFTGSLAGAFPVTVNSSGTVQLSGTNSYTGTTTLLAGTLNVNSPLIGTSAIIVNAGVLNANAAGAAGAVSVSISAGATFDANVANALNGSTVTVLGSLFIGTFGVAGSATQADAAITISYGGVARVLGSGNLGTGLITVGPGLTAATPQLLFDAGAGNTVTYGNATLSVNGGTVAVISGSADMTSNNTTLAVSPITNTAGGLQATEYDGTGFGTLNDGAPVLNRTPNQVATLTGAINFPGSNTPFQPVFPSAPGVATVFFVGVFTPTVSGTYQFQIVSEDDDAIVWLDLNQNGIFEAANGENLVQRTCCGAAGPTSVNLVAGQQYRFAVGWDNTGGPGNLEVQFKGGNITTFTDINPSAANQAGLWSFTSGGGTINIDSGATLKVGAVTGNPNVNVDTNDIREAFFVGAPATSFLNPINSGNGLLTQTPVVVKTLSGALTFDQSDGNNASQLNAESGGVTGTVNFSAYWQATLSIATPGTYSFGTSSDDGSVIYINGTLVVNNNAFQGNTAKTGNYTFTSAGQYTVLIGYYQGTGGATMEARFAPGANVAYASQTIINPFDPNQAGMWSIGSGPGVFQISSSTATTSSLGTVTIVGGATPLSASLNIGANNTVTAANLSIGSNVTLTIPGVGGTGGTFTVTSSETYGTGSTTNITTGTTVFGGPGTGTGAINESGTLRITNAAATSSSSAVTINSGGRFDVAATNAQLANVIVNAGAFLRLSNPLDTTAGASVPTAVMNGTLEINNTAIGPNFNSLLLGNGITVTSLVAGANYASNLILAGSNVNFNTSGTGGSFTVSGVISDGGNNFAITKLGANTLTLAGNNTYGGGTTLNAGTLLVANPTGSTTPSGLGTGKVTLNAGILDLRNDGTASNQVITLGNNVIVAANVTINVDHVAANTGNTIALGTLTIGAQTLTITGGDGYRLSFGATTLSGNPTFTSTTANLTLGALNDGGTAHTLTSNGAGTLTLNAAATSLVGGTQVNVAAGTLMVSNASALGTLATVTITNSTVLALSASPTLGSLADGGAANTGTVQLNGNTLTVGSTNNLSSTFFGAIVNGSGAGGLIKGGTATFILPGSSTYTGTTTVNAGTLQVDGSLVSTVVTNNGGTLSGTGKVGSITASGGTVSPGDVPGTVATLTTTGPAGSALGGAVVIFDLNSSTADKLINTGAGVVNLTSATLNVNLVALGSFGQTYTIVSSAGGISGTFANAGNNSDIVLGGHVFRVSYSSTTVTLSDEGTESSLVFVQQPTTGVTNTPLTPAPAVELLDQAGHVVTSDTTRTITALIGTNPAGGVLSGVLTVSFRNGVATFSALTIDQAGSGFTLMFSSAGLASITSQAFTLYAPLSLPSTLPPAVVGVPYNQSLITGGTPPFTATLVSGALPPGLTLGPGAVLTGTATTTGNFAFTLQITDATGAVHTQSFAFTVQLRTLNATILVTGADAGGLPQVTVYNAQTMQLVTSFWAFPGYFTGGVRVAVGDVNGDGIPDIIAGAGPGGGPEVNVYDGRTGQLIRSFFALPPSFRGGVFVAAGDINGDGYADIIVGADAGGSPQVTVYSGKDGSVLTSFYAMPPRFTGGVRVAAGDMNGDGKADIITGAGPGGSPEVAIYDGATSQLLNAYFALDPIFTGGIYVAFGNKGGVPEVVVGSGPGLALPLIPPSGISEPDASRVSLFDITGTEQTSFLAFPPIASAPFFLGGVRVGTIVTNGGLEILTGAGPSGGPEMKVFDAGSLQPLDNFFTLPLTFTGGLFVAGG
jgi:autotransporter-associated beta strand protein